MWLSHFLLQQEHRFTHNLHVLLLWSLSRREDRVWTLLHSDMHIEALHQIFHSLLFLCDFIALFFVFLFFFYPPAAQTSAVFSSSVDRWPLVSRTHVIA